MNKKYFGIVVGILVTLLAAEGIYLINHFIKGGENSEAEKAGTVSVSGTLNITDGEMESQIPSYVAALSEGEDNNTYVVIEDLPKRTDRFEFINNGTILNYNTEKKNELVPDTSSDTEIPENAPIYKGVFSLGGKDVRCYTTYGVHLVSTADLESRFKDRLKFSDIMSKAPEAAPNSEATALPALAAGSTTSGSAASIQGEESTLQAKRELPNRENAKKIIVLDPGHGKSSSKMTDSEKTAAGYVKTGKGWGEWRHWKTGTANVSCEGSGCAGTHPASGSCWYPIGNGDRAAEPEINLNNALNAKKYLEQMGYTVRMTRTTNDENPSFTNRISYCYPNNDNTQTADAELIIVIHSNAGGGSGSAYISAGGEYTQKLKSGTSTVFVNNSNELGRLINDKITESTSLSKCGGGVIGGEEWLIAFNKSPVPVAYLEIGFFDNSRDLSILRSETDKIGQAIAQGADEYIKSH